MTYIVAWMHYRALSAGHTSIVLGQNVENANNQLNCAVICPENGTITMFEPFFEGHSTDSVMYDLWDIHIQSLLISYHSSAALPLYGMNMHTKHVPH